LKAMDPLAFARVKMIGAGDVGRVYLVEQVGEDSLFAMKVLSKREMVARNKIKRCLTEREVLATVEHPFIVTMHFSFQTPDFLYFITDYCAGGEFLRMLKKQPNNRVPEEWIKFYGAEVLLALEYLHQCGFVYRDLKPENLLLHESGHIMLTDFDLAKQAQAVTPTVVRRSMMSQFKKVFTGGGDSVKFHTAEPVLNTNSFVGTEEYLAPEVIGGVGHNSSVDWWTFGVLCYEMAFGHTPFKGESQNATFSNITSKDFKIVLPADVPISKNCKKMIKGLLSRDPKTRLGAARGASDIKKSPFFEDVKWQLIRNAKPVHVPTLSGRYDTSNFQHIPDDEDEVLDRECPWAPGRGPSVRTEPKSPSDTVPTASKPPVHTAPTAAASTLPRPPSASGMSLSAAGPPLDGAVGGRGAGAQPPAIAPAASAPNNEVLDVIHANISPTAAPPTDARALPVPTPLCLPQVDTVVVPGGVNSVTQVSAGGVALSLPPSETYDPFTVFESFTVPVLTPPVTPQPPLSAGPSSPVPPRPPALVRANCEAWHIKDRGGS